MSNKAHIVAITKQSWSTLKEEDWDVVRNERKCTCCDTTEDEFQCVVECPKYADESICNFPVYLEV